MTLTALDTNVILDILIPNEQFADLAESAIEAAASDGLVVVCDMVYAEVCSQFATQKECDRFFADSVIRVEPLNREALFMASRIWRRYRKQGGSRARILPDFMVGAHAQVQANRLISRNRGFYRSMFPELAVSDPSSGRKPGR
jgi:predicted nucleic acid-binding protein